MKLILCKNEIPDGTGGTRECGRFLGILTDFQIECLRIDQENKTIFRCPSCGKRNRWVMVTHDGDGLKFQVCTKKPHFPEEAKYTDVRIASQVY